MAESPSDMASSMLIKTTDDVSTNSVSLFFMSKWNFRRLLAAPLCEAQEYFISKINIFNHFARIRLGFSPPKK